MEVGSKEAGGWAEGQEHLSLHHVAWCLVLLESSSLFVVSNWASPFISIINMVSDITST